MDLQKEWQYFRAMLKKEYLIFVRYPIAVIATFATPLFLVMIFSFTGISFLNNPNEQQIQQLATFMYIGILGYIYLEVANAASTGIRDEQHQGTLEALFMTPATKVTNVISRIAIRFIFLSINAIVIYLVLAVILTPIRFQNPLLGGYFFLLLILQFISIGFVIAALTLKLKETAIILSNLIVFFVMIFSSFFYSFSTFPDGILYYIPRILPMSYTIDAMRSAFLGFPTNYPELLPFWQEFVLTSVTTIIMVLFSMWIYLYYERQIRKQATLVEY